MEAGKLMKKTVTISPDTTVTDAIELMAKKRLREVVLIDNNKMIGMVTIRSLIDPGVKKDLEVSKFAFMPPVVDSDEDISRVIYDFVDTGLQTIPVLDNLEFKGVVTSKEVLLNFQLSGKVKDTMVDVITVDTKDPISKARAIMMINHINRVPVLEKGKLIGIITSSDIARRVFLSKYGRFHGHQVTEPDLNQPVGRFMTKPVITVGPDNKLEEAKTIMLEYDLKTLPVVVGHKLVGILCRLDMLKKLAPRVSGVRVYFSGLEDQPDDLVSAIEKHTKKSVNKLAMSGKIDRVEITLKRVSESAYKVKIKAGRVGEEVEGDDLLISVKRAFKRITSKLGIK
jgi:CBS domain-containing protein